MINIISDNDINWQSHENGNFSYQRKSFTQLSQSEKLGASLYKLAPNKKAFPLHCHYANEEAIYILSGSGIIRDINHNEHAIKTGDYIVFPTGKEHAHQVINNSQADLIYLCISTLIEPDVMEYPDSNKITIKVGSAPGAKATEQTFAKSFKKESNVDYFEGES